MNFRKKYGRGFTLLEMMIVVALIAILAAIAFPTYQRYVLRSHRVDARNTLQAAAQRLEQNFSANRTYACTENKKKADCTSKIDAAWLSGQGLNISPANGELRYNISFTAGEPGDRTYRLQAVPVGVQEEDECGTFTINQSGVKGVGSGTEVTEASRKLAAKCWSS